MFFVFQSLSRNALVNLHVLGFDEISYMGLYDYLPRSPGMHNFQKIYPKKHYVTLTNSFRLIPAANMGEYEPPRERPEDGGLYPLNAEVDTIANR